MESWHRYLVSVNLEIGREGVETNKGITMEMERCAYERIWRKGQDQTNQTGDIEEVDLLRMMKRMKGLPTEQIAMYFTILEQISCSGGKDSSRKFETSSESLYRIRGSSLMHPAITKLHWPTLNLQWTCALHKSNFRDSLLLATHDHYKKYQSSRKLIEITYSQ